MVVAAEGAGADAALTAGCRVSSSRLPVSLKRPDRCARTVVNSAAPADVPARSVPCVGAGTTALTVKSAAAACSSVESVPVIKRSAPGVVPAVVKHCIVVMPIESPMTPAPSKTAEPADSEARAPRQIRAAKPDSRIRIPSRPRHYRPSVSQPRVIRGDVYDIGAGGLNADVRVLRCDGLLRRGFKIAGFLRPPAHHLYGIHHILLLVVVGVA